MQSMRAMTKKDLIEFVEEKFKNFTEDETIATLFQCGEAGCDKYVQQCIMFHKEIR